MPMTSMSTSATATATCGWINNAGYVGYPGQAVQDHGRYTNEIICTAPGSFCAVEPNFLRLQCVPALTSAATNTAYRTYSGISSVATGYTALFYTTCVDSANATQTTSNPYALTCTESAYPVCTTLPANIAGGVPVPPITVSMITCVPSATGTTQVVNLFTTASTYIEYLAMTPVTMAQFNAMDSISVSGLGSGGGPAVGIPAYTAYLTTTINSNPTPTQSGGSRTSLRLSGVLAATIMLSLLFL